MKEISCRSIPSYGHPIGNLFSYEFGMTDRRKIPNLGAFSFSKDNYSGRHKLVIHYIDSSTAPDSREENDEPWITFPNRQQMKIDESR